MPVTFFFPVMSRKTLNTIPAGKRIYTISANAKSNTAFGSPWSIFTTTRSAIPPYRRNFGSQKRRDKQRRGSGSPCFLSGVLETQKSSRAPTASAKKSRQGFRDFAIYRLLSAIRQSGLRKRLGTSKLWVRN